MNWGIEVLAKTKVTGTGSALAKSFSENANFIKINKPDIGSLVHVQTPYVEIDPKTKTPYIAWRNHISFVVAVTDLTIFICWEEINLNQLRVY